MSVGRPRQLPGLTRDAAIAASVAGVFLALRAAILSTRTIFFDELFSVWMARQPLRALLANLQVDSGPPLYYVLARFPDVVALRWLSVAIAVVPLVVLLKQRRWIAALLLAVHPAAALFAATARPYALAASLIAVALLLLERHRLGLAATTVVAAAYTHYLAVVFFPLLIFAKKAPWRTRIAAGALAGLAFVPGLLLATTQPKDATAWMTTPDLEQVLRTVAFLSDDPGVPLFVIAAAAVLTLTAGAKSWRRAPLVFLPLALIVVLSFFRPALYGIRFASLLAFPVVLWLEEGLENWGGAPRRILTLLLVAAGTAAIGAGIVEHLNRPMGEYRQAAIVLGQNVRPDETIVATGYLFLETANQLPGREILAFPAEQGVHPGWRVPPGRGLDPATLPRGEFVWIGERSAPELAMIRRVRRTRVLFANGRAVILRVW